MKKQDYILLLNLGLVFLLLAGLGLLVRFYQYDGFVILAGVAIPVLVTAVLYRILRDKSDLSDIIAQQREEIETGKSALASERQAFEKLLSDNIGLAEENFLAREEAEANNRLVSAIMENMPQAVCAVAPDGTLLKWNKKFEPLFNLAEGTVRAGMAFSEVTGGLDQAVLRIPDYDEDEEQPVPAKCRELDIPRDILQYERDMTDGRTLEVFRTPMPDGGFIATYTDISERKKSEMVIRHRAHYDALTGLTNRVRFHEKLDSLLQHNRHSDRRFAVVMIDLDKFKDVNDTHGHPMGDSLLITVAGIFSTTIRNQDVAARFGGDEFALLFSNVKQVEEIMIPLNRIMEKVNRPLEVEGETLQIGASMGVALYPLHARTPEDLVKVADEALYAAKKAGRGRIMLAPAPGSSTSAKGVPLGRNDGGPAGG